MTLTCNKQLLSLINNNSYPNHLTSTITDIFLKSWVFWNVVQLITCQLLVIIGQFNYVKWHIAKHGNIKNVLQNRHWTMIMKEDKHHLRMINYRTTYFKPNKSSSNWTELKLKIWTILKDELIFEFIQNYFLVRDGISETEFLLLRNKQKMRKFSKASKSNEAKSTKIYQWSWFG